MTVEIITEDDLMCHWVFEPKNYPADKPECLNLNIRGFYFSSGSAHPYHMSVNSKNLCENYPEEIHNKGFQQAARLSQIRQDHEDRENERYIGFVSADVLCIVNIEYDDHYLSVQHAPLQGNYPHCNIVLNFPEHMNKPSSSKRDKIVNELNKCFDSQVSLYRE